MPKIDFSKVQGIEPLPEGWYNLTVEGAETKVSQAGNDIISLKCHVDDGTFAGRSVFDMLVFSEKTLWRVKSTLQAINPKAFGKDFKGEVEAEDLIGKSFQGYVTIEEGTQVDPATGEPYPARNRIKKLRPFKPTGKGLL